MRTLLDECLPTVLRLEISDHDVRTVKYMGWHGIRNGRLLELMKESGFEAFITIDQDLRFQQNLRASGIGVIQLSAKSNRIEGLVPLMPQIRSVLGRIKPGELITIGD